MLGKCYRKTKKGRRGKTVKQEARIDLNVQGEQTF